jgi:DNA polymerase III epsilon subunit-like protein
MYTRRFWVDTETTGLNPKKHFAFQISYLIEENNALLLRRTLETRPEMYYEYEFSRGAEDVHRFTRDKIISFLPEPQAVDILVDDLKLYGAGRLTIAGYNVNFDMGFIKELFKRTGYIWAFNKYFDYLTCDVMQFAQACRVAGMIRLERINLESVCKYFGINTEGAHSSMTDILNTKSVFDKLCAAFRGGQDSGLPSGL